LRKVLSFSTTKKQIDEGSKPKSQIVTKTVSAEMIRDIIEGKIPLPYNQLFILPDIGLLNCNDLDVALLRSIISGSEYDVKTGTYDPKIEELGKQLNIKVEPFQGQLDLTISQMASLFQIPLVLFIPEEAEIPDRDSPADFRVIHKDKYVAWTKMIGALKTIKDGSLLSGLEQLKKLFEVEKQNEASLTALLTYVHIQSLHPDVFSHADQVILIKENIAIIQEPLTLNFSNRLKSYKKTPFSRIHIKDILLPDQSKGLSVFEKPDDLARIIQMFYSTDPYLHGLPADFVYEKLISLDLKSFGGISQLKGYYLKNGFMALHLLTTVLEKKNIIGLSQEGGDIADYEFVEIKSDSFVKKDSL
jgi:hypothetical protein